MLADRDLRHKLRIEDQCDAPSLVRRQRGVVVALATAKASAGRVDRHRRNDQEIDPGERHTLKALGVTVYTMRDVDERGMRDVVDEAIGIASDGTAGVHLSLDLDVVDPEHAPGTGTPVRGGITFREAHLAMELLSDRAHLVAMDLVEVNPVLDTQNMTGILAAEPAQSLLGKRIL